MTSRPSTAAPILAGLAVVLVTLGAFVGGYFFAGDGIVVWKSNKYSPEPIYIREYPFVWQRRLYAPGGWLE